MGAADSVCYTLDSTLPVLLRPDGTVQVGWHPQRALLVRPPAGLAASALAALLRAMQLRIDMAELSAQALDAGLVDTRELAELVDSLIAAGVVSRLRAGARSRAVCIRVHGRGPLADLMTTALRSSGARVRHTGQRGAGVDNADLVVLSDYLLADSPMIRELHAKGAPHLSVRVRDGTGLVGPMVIPGVTSCLGCADLHRCDRDPAWPAVAAQLRGSVGTADRATVLATAALAINQVDRIVQAIRGDGGRHRGPPPILDTTLEIDVRTTSVVTRHWTRHPHCSC